MPSALRAASWITLALIFTLLSPLASAQRGPGVTSSVDELTIAQIHGAIKAGRLTCRGLVDAYLRRIDAYDKQGPAINAIVVVNPAARDEAAALDRRFSTSGFAGPLHCVPAIVKDNFETIGLQSAAGSLALKGFVSTRDAFQVKKLKDAGAIVLAKSNMAEWAFTPYETVSSILPGYTKNPYALDRVTAGSSGGTAAAVAANFGAIGLGSDTGNSIRGPASHQALVGIRSTMGLTSRGGVVPLSVLADIAGPMTRTVEDAVAVLQAIAGEDPADPITIDGSPMEPFRPSGKPAAIPVYASALRRDGLKGARIGVLRQAYERDTTDPEIVQVFTRALDAARRHQAGYQRRHLRRLQVRHQPVPGGPWRSRPRQEPRRHYQVPTVPSNGSTSSRAVAGGIRERAGHAGVQGGGRVPPAGPESRDDGDGHNAARRIRISDLEQPAAPDRRPEYAARR
jgi:amidase